MSDYSPAILLVTGIITVIILTIGFFLIIPLRISLLFSSRGMETQGICAGSWFIFGFEVSTSGEGPKLSVRICGARIITRTLTTFMDRKKEPPGVPPDPVRIPGIVSSLPALQGPVIVTVLDLIRHTRFDYIRGNARIGLGDPSATGMLYGLFRAITPMF